MQCNADFLLFFCHGGCVRLPAGTLAFMFVRTLLAAFDVWGRLVIR
jgi:hypothetical protein